MGQQCGQAAVYFAAVAACHISQVLAEVIGLHVIPAARGDQVGHQFRPRRFIVLVKCPRLGMQPLVHGQPLPTKGPAPGSIPANSPPPPRPPSAAPTTCPPTPASFPRAPAG